MEVATKCAVADGLRDLAHDPLHLVGEKAPVGVTHHEPLGTGVSGSRQYGDGEVGVGAIPVEEVLGVEEHTTAFRAEILDGVGHHGDGLVLRRAQRMLDVVVPCLADEADRLGSGGEQRGELRVVLGSDRSPPGRPERHQRGRFEVELVVGPRKELVVLGVGPRPPPLDECHAELVEQACDPQLVAGGERDAFLLGAVAEGRVVDLDRFRHDVPRGLAK